jgi:hypothetical protein
MKLLKRFWEPIRGRPQWFTGGTALFLVSFGFALRLLIGLGVSLIAGIGDGYPTFGMKIVGAIVLLLTVLMALGIAIAFIVSLFCLLSDRRLDTARKAPFLFGVGAILSTALFFAWRKGGEDAALDAIVRGDAEAYRAAVSRRSKGSIDDDLWLAARWGRVEIVRELLSQGAHPNARLGGTGSTVLEAAIENLGNQPNGNAEVIGILRRSTSTNVLQFSR